MAFKDNIGVQEELKVEMQECEPRLLISRVWLQELHSKLIGLRLPLQPRERLEELIADIEKVLNG